MLIDSGKEVPPDHSLTYKTRSFKNTVHAWRARELESVVAGQSPSLYVDVGCSNGYMTHRLGALMRPEHIKGLDHAVENLEIARRQYPDIQFEFIDLNKVATRPFDGSVDFLTCLETLEHVGDIDSAIENLKAMIADTGTVLITVPIESGPIGFIKYLLKRVIYRYDTSEIGLHDRSQRQAYAKDLLFNRRIDHYRDKRDGWSTHFGFDYRCVEELCATHFKSVSSSTSGTTRFIRCRQPVR